jgi:hypothetical protein
VLRGKDGINFIDPGGVDVLFVDLNSFRLDQGTAESVSSTTQTIEGMNLDGDRVNQMMDSHATPELFQELRERDEQAAVDFAMRNPEYQGRHCMTPTMKHSLKE